MSGAGIWSTISVVNMPQIGQVTVRRGEDEGELAKLGPYLAQWEFRPAIRDGRPVEVEMLLVIPAADK